MNIIIRQFIPEDVRPAQEMIYRTIRISYASFYSPREMEFFFNEHTIENILKESDEGYTVVALDGDKITGTGTLSGPHIGRVYTDPAYQGNGIGRRIMTALETKARADGIARLDLCASLPSKEFYLRMGYTIAEESYACMTDGITLHYFGMAKTLD
jgi:GNAT superfamily N-acetyltransferase